MYDDGFQWVAEHLDMAKARHAVAARTSNFPSAALAMCRTGHLTDFSLFSRLSFSRLDCRLQCFGRALDRAYPSLLAWAFSVQPHSISQTPLRHRTRNRHALPDWTHCRTTTRWLPCKPPLISGADCTNNVYVCMYVCMYTSVFQLRPGADTSGCHG